MHYGKIFYNKTRNVDRELLYIFIKIIFFSIDIFRNLEALYLLILALTMLLTNYANVYPLLAF